MERLRNDMYPGLVLSVIRKMPPAIARIDSRDCYTFTAPLIGQNSRMMKTSAKITGLIFSFGKIFV